MEQERPYEDLIHCYYSKGTRMILEWSQTFYHSLLACCCCGKHLLEPIWGLELHLPATPHSSLGHVKATLDLVGHPSAQFQEQACLEKTQPPLTSSSHSMFCYEQLVTDRNFFGNHGFYISYGCATSD